MSNNTTSPRPEALLAAGCHSVAAANLESVVRPHIRSRGPADEDAEAGGDLEHLVGSADVVLTTSFLMTDIEGSTGHWEREPLAMAHAMLHHDALVAAAVEQVGGRLVRAKGEGDSAFAVFLVASCALAAAVDLQRRVERMTWPTSQPFRLRVVVATGDVGHREGDVYGLAVCRAARVRALARGGQIAVTAATAALVADALPAGTTLADKGVHRLAGSTRAEHVYGLDWQTRAAGHPPRRRWCPWSRRDTESPPRR
jgi:class 3 adenylate cyclase